MLLAERWRTGRGWYVVIALLFLALSGASSGASSAHAPSVRAAGVAPGLSGQTVATDPASHCVPTLPVPSPTGGSDAVADHAGTYVAADGSTMTVVHDRGALTLASGPMTFTLTPCADGRFGTRERDLTIVFVGDALTVLEHGHVVAQAVRGAAPPEPVAFQGKALSQWLDATVPGLLARYRVPAAAIAYVAHGRIAFTRVYGERRHGIPARSNTLFNVASLTKPITAETLLRLASAGRLDLDATMAPEWIDPDLASDPRARLLTVRMALQHRTGLPNWRSQTGNVLSFVVEPGTTFRYSGEGYTYAANYAERHLGTPFEQLARERVFDPIGMHDTYYTVRPDFAARAAYPHDAQGHELWPAIRIDFSGACCLHTTIADYARFVVAVMHDRSLSPALAATRFAPPRDQRDEMCTGDGLAPANCPPRIGMGLGWMIFGYPTETVVTHTGVNDGERSAAFFVPERDIGLVVLTNGANGAKLIRDVTAAAYDNPAYQRIVATAAK